MSGIESNGRITEFAAYKGSLSIFQCSLPKYLKTFQTLHRSLFGDIRVGKVTTIVFDHNKLLSALVLLTCYHGFIKLSKV